MKGLQVIGFLLGLTSFTEEVNAIRVKNQAENRIFPYNDDEEELSLQQLNMENQAIQQQTEGSSTEQSAELLAEAAAEKHSENEIDAAAEAFVESDDTLNTQLEEAKGRHILINKGYPYND